MPISDEIRNEIYNKLKKHLKACMPPMKSASTAHHSFHIIGNKPVPYGYDKKIVPGMFFAGIANRKDSVTLHFFPIYMDGKLKSVAPSLVKCLKGKTCFHFKKVEQINDKELS